MLYEPDLDPTLATRLGQLRDEPGQAVTNPRIRDGSTVAKASPAPCLRRQKKTHNAGLQRRKDHHAQRS